ncbi:MAG: hypothetical protein LCH38_07120 [Proteobacteria bacterium]|nr:hypothetical protein [Pseudomonadota bacterium]
MKTAVLEELLRAFHLGNVLAEVLDLALDLAAFGKLLDPIGKRRAFCQGLENRDVLRAASATRTHTAEKADHYARPLLDPNTRNLASTR